MDDPTDPREVLAAVRRLEAELDELRVRMRRGAGPDLDELRRGIAEDAAAERRLLVEDLETVLELIGASWRSSREFEARMDARMDALDAHVAALRATVEGARVEVRFGDRGPVGPTAPAYTNGTGHRPAG